MNLAEYPLHNFTAWMQHCGKEIPITYTADCTPSNHCDQCRVNEDYGIPTQTKPPFYTAGPSRFCTSCARHTILWCLENYPMLNKGTQL